LFRFFGEGVIPVYNSNLVFFSESAVHFECKLVHTYEMHNAAGEVSATLVLGEVGY